METTSNEQDVNGFEEDDEDNNLSKQMIAVTNHQFNVSIFDGYRFPVKQFGYNLLGDVQPFTPVEYDLILRKLIPLEKYCDADDASRDDNLSTHNDDIDLFYALFFPKTISPRTPMSCNHEKPISCMTLRFMWLRLVLRYFEWLAGISELRYLADNDKIKLIVGNLCKIICFQIAFGNYADKNFDFLRSYKLSFGSGFFWDPLNHNENLINEYCMKIWTTLKNHVIPHMIAIQMTYEEFIFAKIIALFDCTNLDGLSEDGIEFCRCMCTKYRCILSDYIRERIGSTEIDKNKINELAVERMSRILKISKNIDIIGELDDQGLTMMVQSNYGGMQKKLQLEVHLLSKKKCHNNDITS